MSLYVVYHASTPTGSAWGSIELDGRAPPRTSADMKEIRDRILANDTIKAAGIYEVILMNWSELSEPPSAPETTTYLIYATDADGESLDTVVEANSKEEAEALWRKWCDDNGFEPDEKDYVIYMLPAKRNYPCVLEWDDQAGIVNVKDSRH